MSRQEKPIIKWTPDFLPTQTGQPVKHKRVARNDSATMVQQICQ